MLASEKPSSPRSRIFSILDLSYSKIKSGAMTNIAPILIKHSGQFPIAYFLGSGFGGAGLPGIGLTGLPELA